MADFATPALARPLTLGVPRILPSWSSSICTVTDPDALAGGFQQRAIAAFTSAASSAFVIAAAGCTDRTTARTQRRLAGRSIWSPEGRRERKATPAVPEAQVGPPASPSDGPSLRGVVLVVELVRVEVVGGRAELAYHLDLAVDGHVLAFLGGEAVLQHGFNALDRARAAFLALHRFEHPAARMCCTSTPPARQRARLSPRRENSATARRMPVGICSDCWK